MTDEPLTPRKEDPRKITVPLVIVSTLVGVCAFLFCFVIATLVSNNGPSLFTSSWPATLFPASSGGVPPAPILVVILSFGINWFAWIPASVLQTERFYDLVGMLTFLASVGGALGVAGHFNLPMTPWRVLPAVMVALWTLRLGGFLFYRIHTSSRGDKRFDDFKVNPVRFFIPWTIQSVWVCITSIAMVVQVNSPHTASSLIAGSQLGSAAGVASANHLWNFFDFTTVVGILLWIIGFALEIVADVQKLRFSSDSKNRGRYIREGVWSWCRHPNYFGEITLWVGVWLMGLRGYVDAQWLVMISPIQVAVLLLFVSGLPQLETMADERWIKEAEYRQYKRDVHVMIPFASQLCGCCRETVPEPSVI